MKLFQNRKGGALHYNGARNIALDTVLLNKLLNTM